MRCLGLDLGSKTLGVATSDYTNTIATSLKTIFYKENDYESLIEELKRLVYDYEITDIILGLPKNMNNTLGERAEISLKFKEMIEKNIDVKVNLVDERLTTVISNNIMIEANVSRKKRKKKVDSIAAQLILQSYLDKINNERTHNNE